MTATLRSMVVAGALVLAAGSPLRSDIVGPSDLPEQLPGTWQIGLCISESHTWISLQNMETGEVHTLGRYVAGMGGEFDRQTGRQVWPRAEHCGVTFDFDLKYHLRVRTDGRVLRTCCVRNPRIYRGKANGYGHCIVRMNCVTYVRDAWHFYTGEWYDLPPVALPEALAAAVSGNR